MFMCLCYVIVMIMFYVLCHKRPGALQDIKVTAHIRATLIKGKGGRSTLVLNFKSEL